MRAHLPRVGASSILALACILGVSPVEANAQAAQYDTSLYRGLVWREVGPFRGGRVTAVAGSAAQPLVYYMGGTGGGVWRTVDGALTVQPVSAEYLAAGSIGALGVAARAPNVVYAGAG